MQEQEQYVECFDVAKQYTVYAEFILTGKMSGC